VKIKLKTDCKKQDINNKEHTFYVITFSVSWKEL